MAEYVDLFHFVNHATYVGCDEKVFLTPDNIWGANGDYVCTSGFRLDCAALLSVFFDD